MQQCIVSQGHIPYFDCQGNLTYEQKTDLMSMSILHLRKFNPDAYIILSGHGYTLERAALDCCDFVYWESKCRPLNAHGYPTNNPAQFTFVSKGVEHAKSKGFDYILKTRTDCIMNIPNIYSHCINIINMEEKDFLLTQQTGSDGSSNYIGDCFMFGPIDKMSYLWHEKNPIKHQGGLMNTAAHFAEIYLGERQNPWKDFVKKHASFRDVINLGIIDLRWNYNSLMEQYGQKMRDRILNNKLEDINQYHWGRANGWHIFNENGEMIINSNPSFWSEKEFYNG